MFGDVSVSGGFTLLRDNDIYSKVEGTLDYGDYSLVEVDYVGRRSCLLCLIRRRSEQVAVYYTVSVDNG